LAGRLGLVGLDLLCGHHLYTIGYGDFTSTTPLAKVVTIFLALNGVAILLMLFDEIRRVRAWGKLDVPSPEEGSNGESNT
jgi:hypothetical protein